MLTKLLLLIATALASHHDTLDPNRRGIETNRDFSNSFQHGFVQGLLKIT